MNPLPPFPRVQIPVTERELAFADTITKAILKVVGPEIDALAARVTHLELEVRALRSRAGTQPPPAPRRDVPRRGEIIFR